MLHDTSGQSPQSLMTDLGLITGIFQTALQGRNSGSQDIQMTFGLVP